MEVAEDMETMVVTMDHLLEQFLVEVMEVDMVAIVVMVGSTEGRKQNLQ